MRTSSKATAHAVKSGVTAEDATDCPRNWSEMIREALEDEIATGALAPGTRLDEVELSARFQVSRTPVREALHQLATARLIEARPRRSAIVPLYDPQAIFEMFELMAELEASCARLAARRLNAQDRTEISAAAQACMSGGAKIDPDAYYRENETLHQAIYHAGHNRLLEAEAFALQRRLRPYRRLQLRLPGRITSSRAEHQALIAAIFANDAEQAARLARDHVLIQGHGFGEFLLLLGPR